MSIFRSEVEAMQGYQPGEQPRTRQILKLNTNESPYSPSPQALEAMRAASSELLSRYPDPMAEQFREVAASLYGVEPDWILAGNGSDDLLTIITRACVPSGGTIVFPTPSYTLYRTLAQIQGAVHRETPFDQAWSLDDNFTNIDASLALIPNPNSPSGTVISQPRLREIAANLQRKQTALVIDEAYADFAETNCVDLVHEFPNLIVTRTLSKSYGLAGLRFGFAIAQPDVIAGLAKVKDSYNCNRISIAGATAAILDQEYLLEVIIKVKQTRQRLERAMTDLGFRVIPSQANFVWCLDGPSQPRSIYQALRDQGILIRYMKYEGITEGIRVSVGTDHDIDRFLAAISPLLSSQKQ